MLKIPALRRRAGYVNRGKFLRNAYVITSEMGPGRQAKGLCNRLDVDEN